jgi:hypothetical protein
MTGTAPPEAHPSNAASNLTELDLLAELDATGYI